MKEVDMNEWISMGNIPSYGEFILHYDMIYDVKKYLKETNEIETKSGIVLPADECKIVLK